VNTELTHFQKTIRMALDLSIKEASKVQHGWPKTEESLTDVLDQWKSATGAQVPGLQLLIACREIWRHRPTDLAEAEGREILYHPIDGSSIQQGSPMDSLSWEMLAFLRWANRKGSLQWTDGITIVREIQKADGNIDNLPLDRFYAKRTLPRLPDGNIDWSNVELAQAKAFVQNGYEVRPEPEPEPVLESNWGSIGEDRLDGVLASIPALNSVDARTQLLRGLPPNASAAIRRPPAPGPDLYNIVAAAHGMGELANGEMAINVVIGNARRLVAGTALAAALDKFKV
jgi:hypothetical protein